MNTPQPVRGTQSLLGEEADRFHAVIAAFNTSRAWGATETDATSVRADASRKGFQSLRELAFAALR